MQAPQVYYALEVKLAMDKQNRRSLCHTQSVRQAALSGPHTAASLATPDGLQSAVKAATWPTDFFGFCFPPAILALWMLTWAAFSWQPQNCPIALSTDSSPSQEAQMGTAILGLLLHQETAKEDLMVPSSSFVPCPAPVLCQGVCSSEGPSSDAYRWKEKTCKQGKHAFCKACIS